MNLVTLMFGKVGIVHGWSAHWRMLQMKWTACKSVLEDSGEEKSS